MAAVFFVKPFGARLRAKVEQRGRGFAGKGQKRAAHPALLVGRQDEQLGDGAEEIPLVDKGNYGFHCPCPHRTLLRPLDIGIAMPAGPRLVLLGTRIVKTL